MKQESSLIVLLMFFALCTNAVTKNVRIPLWDGTMKVTDDWSGGSSVRQTFFRIPPRVMNSQS